MSRTYIKTDQSKEFLVKAINKYEVEPLTSNENQRNQKL